MKNKRIGIISMGLTLILFGILMIIGQISQVKAFDYIVKLWPIILIILGIETLYINYKYGDDSTYNMKFDFWSIIIVMFILFTNLFLYGLMEIGVIDRIRDEIDYRDNRYEMENEEENSAKIENKDIFINELNYL